MSYYVKYLIHHQDEIRKAIVQEDHDRDIGIINFEDDIYQDLLTVEQEIGKLNHLGLISSKEKTVLRIVQSGIAPSQIDPGIMDRHTANSIFDGLCQRIAFSLGDYFTDDGFYAYMCEKYQLNIQQEQKLHKLIFGSTKANTNEKRTSMRTPTHD